MPSSRDTDRAEVAPSQSWFDEVRELRQKATEYKRRALGTHFSRQHLGQLYAQQAHLWDGESESASVIPALSLEGLQSSRASTSTEPQYSLVSIKTVLSLEFRNM